MLLTLIKHKTGLYLLKNAMNGQVLTKNPLCSHFLMRKIKRSTFSDNRKGEKAKPLFRNNFNYSFTIFFCPSHRHVISMTWMQIILPNYINIYLWVESISRQKSPFSPFWPKTVTFKFFIICCYINIKHVKLYIYFALVSLYSKGKIRMLISQACLLKA